MKTLISDDTTVEKRRRRSKLVSDLNRYKYLYLMILPAIVFLIIFKYMPMYGVIIAFKNYRFADGIWGSHWVGLHYFGRMFADSTFLTVLRNTLVISLLKLFVGYSGEIAFALILNEVVSTKLKKITQTVSYLPHFVSWVVLAGVFKQLLSLNGPVNGLVELLGGEKQIFLANSTLFVPILILTDMWRQVGWGSIIMLAAITGIDKALYESASIDGANRFQKMMKITLPSLMPVITIMFLVKVGNILNGGFDQIFNLYSPLVMNVGDIIDTYVYRVGLLNMDFSYSTAIGLFKNVVGVTLMLIVNRTTKQANQYGI